MRETIKILFSKAVILTYIFVCYSAITDKETPLCSVNSVPSFSVNDVAYPTAIVIQITSAEHLRPTKESTHYVGLVPLKFVEFIASYTSRIRLESYDLLFLNDPLTRPSRGRAPPVA